MSTQSESYTFDHPAEDKQRKEMEEDYTAQGWSFREISESGGRITVIFTPPKMTIDKITSAIQSTLGVENDGKAGPETWGAIYNKIVKPSKTSTLSSLVMDDVDARSEKVIATLLPEVQPYARSLVHKAATVGIDIKIISGFRNYEEQDELYAQGRTTLGDKVTNAKGGQSNHNFGIAFDIGIFEGDEYLENSPKYKAIGILGVELGLEWGGNWKTITDQPHFQLRPIWAKKLTESEMLAELRTRKESGDSFYA